MTTDTDESGLRLFPVQPVLQDDRVPAGLSVSELARSRKVSSPAAAAISLLSPTKQRSNTDSSRILPSLVDYFVSLKAQTKLPQNLE